jgi:urease accessory protein
VIGMFMGSSLAVLIYYLNNITNPNQFVLYLLDNFADYIYFIVEFGIAFSVLFLGSIICFNKKLPLIYISAIIFSFGIAHGAAHGISIPYVIKPYLFISGFCLGTVLLHLLGVSIGYGSVAYTYIDKTLRLSGILIFFFGVYLITNLF